MSKVQALVAQIRSERKNQVAASSKDEEQVMRAMLNDREFKVTQYYRDGSTEQRCPAEKAREIVANVIHGTTKVSQEEAAHLANNYEFKKSDSINMVQLTKDYVNTYVQTGRKLPLGGTALMDAAISLNEKEQANRTYPMQIGVNEDGSPRYGKGESVVPAHESLKVHASCPVWVK